MVNHVAGGWTGTVVAASSSQRVGGYQKNLWDTKRTCRDQQAWEAKGRSSAQCAGNSPLQDALGAEHFHSFKRSLCRFTAGRAADVLHAAAPRLM